jgi:KDO2-lipid IV(A) lauroyltransferase
VTHFLIRNKHGRSPWLRGAGWRLEAAILSLFWLLVGTLRPAHASALGRRLFRRFGPRTSKHRRVRRNLSIAFPELEQDRIETLARDVWGSFGSVLAEYPHLPELAATQTSAGIDMEIDAETRPVLAHGKPAVYITAHLGNWELVGLAITGMGVPLSVVYAPQGNPVLERLLQAKRRVLGCRFIGKKNALRSLLRELRSGRSVGLLPDQRMDSGEPLPFFGQNTPSPVTPAWLAFKTGCPLIPVQIDRTGDARYRAIFHKPVNTAGNANEREAVVRVTAAINRLFEGWIRQHPEQWLCMKRRWPDIPDVQQGN